MDNLFKFRIKALALIAILLVSAVSAFAQVDTIAIIDAGSSGSRLYMYAVDKSKTEVQCIYPVNQDQGNESKGRQLSIIPNNRDSVRAFLNDMTKKFDNKNKPVKDLYILATAGMRMEEETKTNSIYKHMTDGDSIFNRYKVQCAMTISGRYEGLYAWIAANYDAKTLPGQQGATEPACGILEVGGASMQIAFVPPTAMVQSNEKVSEETASSILPLNAANTIQRGAFGIYSKSYLGGGLNQYQYETNKEDVISGLGEIKASCNATHFFGIGWAFGDLWVDSGKDSPEEKNNKAEKKHM